MPSGRKKRPSSPCRNSSGTNTMTMMTVANTTELRISLLAANVTAIIGRRSDSGSAAFSRMRRNTFSTSMIASSTSSPIATARPPSVITLIDMPAAHSTTSATPRLSGSAVSVISVVRTSSKNSIRMIATKIAASRSTSSRLLTDSWMKSACRMTLGLTSIPAGMVFFAVASCASMASVSASVLVPGDFCTDNTTALRPPSAAVPRGGVGPSTTSATWPMVIAWPSTFFRTVPWMSAAERTRPVCRTGSSRPLTLVR